MTTTRLPKTITAGALLATPIPPVKWINADDSERTNSVSGVLHTGNHDRIAAR